MTLARQRAGVWRMTAPCPVGDVSTLLSRLLDAGQAVVLGVDCPLGLPRAYVAAHCNDLLGFSAFLQAIQARPGFLQVCADLAEVGPWRPFYPARGLRGMTRAAHAAALGLRGPDGLSRWCDRATAQRPAGAPLFWTLGANQSGKAAISAWRDLVLPGLDRIALWPFEGSVASLVRPGRVVVAETYPAEAMRQLGLRMGGSKRRQADRARLGPALAATIAGLGATADAPLAAALMDGFGADAAGEDRFDSVLGLCCVLAVLTGLQADWVPDDSWVRQWEGWVLGQSDLPRGLPAATDAG